MWLVHFTNHRFWTISIALAKGKAAKKADKVIEEREKIRTEETETKTMIKVKQEEIKAEKDPKKAKKLEKVRVNIINSFFFGKKKKCLCIYNFCTHYNI